MSLNDSSVAVMLPISDPDRAQKFYTDQLGFQKKADFSQGSYRWLTVVAVDDPDGVELILESNANPAGKAFQEAVHAQGQPAMQFLVKDAKVEYARLAADGVVFPTPAMPTTGSVIAVLDDTCGNLIQLTQLTWGA